MIRVYPWNISLPAGDTTADTYLIVQQFADDPDVDTTIYATGDETQL